MKLAVLYRGFLTSCNYACGYCPFAKRTETKSRLARDKQSLLRFTDWISGQPAHRWQVLFTPWGEALVRAWYREAIVKLSHLPHVDSVTAQSNLSCGLGWVASCRRDKLALWTTYHPSETNSHFFRRKIRRLVNDGIRLSVGMVGVPEFLNEIETMRRELPSEVYLWINAQQPRPRPYSSEEIKRFTAIDPHFELTAKRFPSRGRPCRTGETTFTVDGNGEMRRCHFVDEIIGNIHDPDWERSLRPRACPNRFCDCFLGKAQLKADSLTPIFGESLLTRIPQGTGTHPTGKRK